MPNDRAAVNHQGIGTKRRLVRILIGTCILNNSVIPIVGDLRCRTMIEMLQGSPSWKCHIGDPCCGPVSRRRGRKRTTAEQCKISKNYVLRTTSSIDETEGRSAGPAPTWCRRTIPAGSMSTSPPSCCTSPDGLRIRRPLTRSFA